MAKQQQAGSRTDIEKAIAKLASTQLGLISRRQALYLGLSPNSIARRLKSGAWVLQLPGVYRLSGAPTSWQGRLLGALFWIGDDGVVSHQSAGALWKLEGIAAGSVELSVNRNLRNRQGVVAHFRRRLSEGEVTDLGPFRVTSATRTLIDLASCVPPETLETALDDALRRRLTSIPRLKWALRTVGKGHKGLKVLRRFVDERDPKTRGSESRLETRLLRLIRDANLPLPVAQYEIRNNGKFVARVDLCYPEYQLILEADSYASRSGLKNWNHDRDRANALVRLHWSILRISGKDIFENPEKVVELVRDTLGHTRLL